MTVQLWGEMPRGEWKLVVSSSDHMSKSYFFFIYFLINLNLIKKNSHPVRRLFISYTRHQREANRIRKFGQHEISDCK